MAQGSFLPENKMLLIFFFDICNAEIGQCRMKNKGQGEQTFKKIKGHAIILGT